MRPDLERPLCARTFVQMQGSRAKLFGWVLSVIADATAPQGWIAVVRWRAGAELWRSLVDAAQVSAGLVEPAPWSMLRIVWDEVYGFFRVGDEQLHEEHFPAHGIPVLVCCEVPATSDRCRELADGLDELQRNLEVDHPLVVIEREPPGSPRDETAVVPSLEMLERFAEEYAARCIDPVERERRAGEARAYRGLRAAGLFPVRVFCRQDARLLEDAGFLPRGTAESLGAENVTEQGAKAPGKDDSR